MNNRTPRAVLPVQSVGTRAGVATNSAESEVVWSNKNGLLTQFGVSQPGWAEWLMFSQVGSLPAGVGRQPSKSGVAFWLEAGVRVKAFCWWRLGRRNGGMGGGSGLQAVAVRPGGGCLGEVQGF